jgi:hypothetical protein
VPLERVQRKVQTDKNRQQVLAYAD